MAEQTECTPWCPPPGYDVVPDPRSRFANLGPLDDPCLPIPSPRLYAYQLPELPPRDGRQSGASGQPGIRRLPPTQATSEPGPIRQIAYQQEDADGSPGEGMGQPSSPAATYAAGAQELRIVALPQSVWESLPSTCLTRMFEFRSVRDEYQQSYRHAVSADLRDKSQRLSLEDIVRLAQINSREFQTQKETLYRTALRLSLERYDYALKFSPTGNGTVADFNHRRTQGITENTLIDRSSVTAEKVLATGGDLLARFANDIVLTFNGPDGFSADVGSELLLRIEQSVFQRDIVFEQLTQSERDVVYAARSFARFRKQLFRELATSYYNLLLSYRGIEIDALDYFSNTRGFYQGEAEYRAGRLPRFQVDQFEQDSLTSRSRLITSCNSLERAMDQIKLQIGLPTEMPINLNLTELEKLTRRDETRASGERVRRARRNLVSEQNQASPERLNLLLNAATSLTRQLRTLAAFRQQEGHTSSDIDRLDTLLARLSCAESRWLVRSNRAELAKEKRAVPESPLRLFQRSMDLIDTLTVLATRQLDLISHVAPDPSAARELDRQLQQVRARYEQLRADLEATVTSRQLDRIPQLVTAADTLLVDVEALVEQTNTRLQYQSLRPEQELQATLKIVDLLLTESEQVLAKGTEDLTAIDTDMDDAMLTALVQRFDLMNQRGSLADDWRRIKLAGDDLRSVLNLSAAQRVFTRRDVNRAFDFTFDDSDTRLVLSLDTPLNRRAQRNAYRQSLIDYQAALRDVIDLEDNIKFSIRNDLRQLQVDREQYEIAVASAALAYERRISTRLQLQFGMAGIRVRDVLDSQRAYTASLNAVARAHITYILDRIELFLDLELLQLDNDGFWPYLYEEEHQPPTQFEIPEYARPAYGRLPCGVWYSHAVKRMLKVPTGQSEVYKERSGQAGPPPDGSGTDGPAGEPADQASPPDSILEQLPPPPPP